MPFSTVLSIPHPANIRIWSKLQRIQKFFVNLTNLLNGDPADCCSHPDVSCISCPKDGPYCCAVIPGLQHEISANEIRSS